MRPIEGSQERKKVKKNLRNPKGTYLDPRKDGKSALMGSLDGPIGGLNRATNGLNLDSSKGP
jgi:hypothetical protein